MKRILYVIGFWAVMNNTLYGQDPVSKMHNYHPVSPSAFQFLKYDEMPVSEYTGVPNITIPLYSFEIDGVTIPIDLTYHAGGIRVSQEASWVGLGWDLNFGSIVQEINDVDDFSPNTNIVRKRPDYKWSLYPTNFPTKYTYPNCSNITGEGWTNPYPITEYDGKYSYMIATANWIPIDGNFDNQPLGESILSHQEYDSEPDVFTANFFGHNVKFKRDQSSSNSWAIQVLNHGYNNGGYKVSKTTNGFYIKTPSGDEFDFEVKSSIISNIENLGGLLTSNFNNYDPSSNIWYLTKIITKNKKQIIFNYSQSGTVSNYPSYSESQYILSLVNAASYNLANSMQPNISGYNELLAGDPNTKTYYHSTENRFFLSSIVFPNGQINFNTSDRNDITGGKRLDAIQVNTDQLIKSYQFNYSYFDASGVGGNTSSPPYNASSFGNMTNLRLKLLSIQDNSGATHYFNYNPTLLPSKNSLAQDFWGYYNGQISNTSLIPNPARLKIIGLADNGNNNSSNLSFTQACVLTSIQYPTGGKNVFEYELNQFDNYWVPDFNTINNEISSGNGLRIHSIGFFASNNEISKKTIYNYQGGKSITPFNVYRKFSVTSIHLNSSQELWTKNYSVDELKGKGFFSSNALGSINGVGYDKVIKTNVDVNGVANGRVETFFNNTPDDFYNSGALPENLSAALPTCKNLNNPENGTVDSVLVYDKNDKRVRKIENTYGTSRSELQYNYGARVFGYLSLFYPAEYCLPSSANPPYWAALPVNLIGYYPVYDIKSLLATTTTTDYDENNNEMKIIKSYSYDNFGQLNRETINKSKVANQTNGQVEHYFAHPYDNYGASPVYTSLLNENRFAEITNEKKVLVKGPANQYPAFIDYDKVDHEYITIVDKIVKSKTTINNYPGTNEMPSVITYNLYDAANANLLEYTAKGVTNSMIWDYNGEYLTAEIANSNYSNIAITSFEADNKGNFYFSGTGVADAFAPTGKKVYSLANGTIARPGLNTTLNYIVSYWSNAGPQAVNGTTAIAGRTLNGFTYYVHKINSPSSGTITISGTDKIDELRLYPENALVTTYTYAPLIGITSQCDPNNKINYYQYDAYSRLSLIRDQDNNILKKICYNYAGQAGDCTSPVYYNDLQQATFTRTTACAAGLILPTYTYSVPAGTYSSYIDKATANQLAINAMNTNGQAAANALPCLAPFSGWNKTSQPWNVTVTNTAGTFNATYSFYPGSAASLFANIPVGTYNISLAPMYAGSVTSPVQLLLNGATYTGTSFNVTNAGINAATTLTLQAAPAAPGPCSFTAAPGIGTPSYSFNNNGTTVSFYIVFYSSSQMMQGVSYPVGTLSTACRPSSQQSFTFYYNGAMWALSIYPNGTVNVTLVYGATSFPPYTTLGTGSTLTYNL